MKKEASFLSANQQNTIYYSIWEPAETPRAILVGVHGMAEHRLRYDEFGRFLADHRILFTMHDHLGHGESIRQTKEYGYFGHPNGNEYLLSDIHHQVLLMKEMYPKIPLFIMGHSMGSFLVRQYICQYGALLTGTIILGTGFQPKALLLSGKAITKALSVFGWHFRSRLVYAIAFGSYLKRIKHPKTTRDWTSRDEALVARDIKDPGCMFILTINGFYQMARSIEASQNAQKAHDIPKDLPMLIASGSEDPVGNYKAGVILTKEFYEAAHIKDITLKLYDGDRHEILNELDRQTVYQDLLQWMLLHL